jgi:nucleoside-diphosphate-sugar epimerase
MAFARGLPDSPLAISRDVMIEHVREIVLAIADAAKLPAPCLSIPRSFAMVVARVLDDAFKRFGAKKPPPLTPFMVTILTRHVVYDASKARRVLGWNGGRDPLDVVRASAAALA